jgi:hypothetical protein
MPTLREELEPLRRLVKGGNYAALRAMIEFIDKADALAHDAKESETAPWYVRNAGASLLALLDRQIE